MKNTPVSQLVVKILYTLLLLFVVSLIFLGLYFQVLEKEKKEEILSELEHISNIINIHFDESYELIERELDLFSLSKDSENIFGRHEEILYSKKRGILRVSSGIDKEKFINFFESLKLLRGKNDFKNKILLLENDSFIKKYENTGFIIFAMAPLLNDSKKDLFLILFFSIKKFLKEHISDSFYKSEGKIFIFNKNKRIMSVLKFTGKNVAWDFPQKKDVKLLDDQNILKLSTTYKKNKNEEGKNIFTLYKWNEKFQVGFLTQIYQTKRYTYFHSMKSLFFIISAVIGIPIILILLFLLRNSYVFEKRLQITQENLRRAQEIAHVGSWIWHIRENKLIWSDEAYRIFALEPQQTQTTYNGFIGFVHIDDRESVEEAIKKTLEADVPFLVEHRIVRKDGKVRIVLEKGRLDRDAQNRPLRLIGVVHDITKFKKIERELRESRDELELRVQERTKELKKLTWALENSPDIIIITDLSGNIEYVNNKFSEVFEYLPEEVIGKNPSLLDAENMTKRDFDKMWKTILSRKTWNGEFYNKSKSGKRIWNFCSISPLIGEHGEITHFISANQDISELKKIEKNLEEAKVKAERASEARSIFLSSMTHELRTPLNAILGFSQLLSRDVQNPLSERQLSNLNQISVAGKHLLQLIDEVLDLSSIEAGQAKVVVDDILLEDIFTDLPTIILVLAHEKNIKVHFPNSFEKVLVRADPIRLKQAVVNFISNAIKYNRKNGEVTIAYERCENQNFVQIVIMDTGIGISKEDLGRIYEPFNRLGLERSNIKGSGIGLSITRKFVELMNGEIEIQSEKGIGTNVFLRIPLVSWE